MTTGAHFEVKSGVAVERSPQRTHNARASVSIMGCAVANAADAQAFVKVSSGVRLRVMCSAASDAPLSPPDSSAGAADSARRARASIRCADPHALA